jgi:hypothetical protein
LFGEHAVVHGVVSSRFTLTRSQGQRRGLCLLCGALGDGYGVQTCRDRQYRCSDA